MLQPAALFPDPLDLAPRWRAFEAARRHSRTVRVLKVAMPSLGLAVALGFGVAAWRAAPAEPAVQAEGAVAADGKLVMANPKLGGFTRDDRPYSMMAERAVQAIGQDDVVELDRIDATLPFDDETATVKAPGGTYDRKANTLAIRSTPEQGIAISTSGGMSASFDRAEIDIAQGGMEAQGDVSLKGNGMVLTSEALAVSGGGKILVFERNVRVFVEPGRVRAAGGKEAHANP